MTSAPDSRARPDLLDRVGAPFEPSAPPVLQHRPGSAGEHDLQCAYGTTARADRFYADQVRDRLLPTMIEFIGRMEMLFLSTADANGECDASLRAGEPGFIQVLDEHHLAYPEYRGNGVHASLGNISENGHVGILMVDFVQDLIGLHVNGKAWIVEDDLLRDQYPDLPPPADRGRAAERWVVVKVDEAYIHCRKHIPRMARIHERREWATDDPARKGGDYFRVKDTPPTEVRLPAPRPAPARTASRADAVAPASGPAPVDRVAARRFIERFYAETVPALPMRERIAQIDEEIDATGSYTHTLDELTFGARAARDGRSDDLRVRDLRHVSRPVDVAEGCIGHLREAGRGGRIRPTITVFAPDRPGRPGPRIHNDQLVRYAGHRTDAGDVRGDGRYAEFTDQVVALGWQRPSPPGRFDVLPLLISAGHGRQELFEIPSDAVLEVPLTHPDHAWFAELRLRWHAVPAIANQPLVIGGVTYPAAPFNGRYLGTEIGARALADVDRYDLLPVVARRLGLDMSSDRTLWRDRAVLEMVRAVQHSFDEAGVAIDEHGAGLPLFGGHAGEAESADRDRTPA
ncbi:nitric oxide synthase oxygenase [Pseudonocardia sp. CA-107938]|uniref:nitric oxide synthase oxygenase n=1 Tax=Pseudonocardia sp. CA-107938 TaxID=3240021 RepID=UPI003D9160F6